jgi:hypothetical protein
MRLLIPEEDELKGNAFPFGNLNREGDFSILHDDRQIGSALIANSDAHQPCQAFENS